NVTYATESQDRMELFDQRYYNDNLTEIPGNRVLQTYERPLDNRQLIIQVDYQKPFSKDKVMEAGYKSTISNNHRIQVFNDFNFETGNFEFNELISNDFYFDEGIHALYSIFKNKWKRLSYQAGLRAELTRTE